MHQGSVGGPGGIWGLHKAGLSDEPTVSLLQGIGAWAFGARGGVRAFVGLGSFGAVHPNPCLND